ncbi:uncharacterized protein LOC134768664 [Penaeus indicus]|uniref:uncharacterized protein LOC134768664 n=1 Tax=Penaeus indicus TaxID=29960 RepID=UPI00300D7598
MNSNHILKLVNEKVNTEDLIYEVERHPEIWNTALEEYGSKVKRKGAWHDIARNFMPDFHDKTLPERREILSVIQKKWKGIRTCYCRELLKRKKEKSGSEACGRKQYVYFENLHFLGSVPKQTTSTGDEGFAASTSMDSEHEVVLDSSPGMPRDDWEAERPRSRYLRKRTHLEEEGELVHVLKKILKEGEALPSEKDEDRLFLLSLVSELHKVPADKKLKLKSDIITAIAQAQQA